MQSRFIRYPASNSTFQGFSYGEKFRQKPFYQLSFYVKKNCIDRMIRNIHFTNYTLFNRSFNYFKYKLQLQRIYLTRIIQTQQCKNVMTKNWQIQRKKKRMINHTILIIWMRRSVHIGKLPVVILSE